VVKELNLPFPTTEFQPYLTEIASIKPDAVFVFFAGGAAAKFMKDYAAAGLKSTTQLLASGFLTDGTIEAAGVGGAPEGLLTTLHYADGINNPKNNSFRASYAKTYKLQPDVYAVQGYDAAQLLLTGLKAVNGNVADQPNMIKAMEGAKIDSPRGPLTISKAHNPIQDIYLRKVVGRDNVLMEVTAKSLADPAVGCKM
jgi:branched-chain amino acid transport system substrate-binding protein